MKGYGWLKAWAGAIFALNLSACALDLSGMTPEDRQEFSYVAACTGYVTILSSIEPFRAQLSDVEVAILQGTMLRVGPICAEARAGNFTNLDESLLRVLQGALRGAQGVLCHQAGSSCLELSSVDLGATSGHNGNFPVLLTAGDCVAKGQVASLLRKLYGEELYWQGWSNVERAGRTLDLFVNQTTGTWTIVSYRGPMGCVEAIGKAHHIVTPGEDA